MTRVDEASRSKALNSSSVRSRISGEASGKEQPGMLLRLQGLFQHVQQQLPPATSDCFVMARQLTSSGACLKHHDFAVKVARCALAV